jgi:quercetin dioxygenase-like cupin family protein
MNKKVNINNLKSKEIVSGFHGKFINGKQMTWAFWEIEKNASIPSHSHIHEQIMHVVSGKFSFTINNETGIFSDGDTIVIPSNLPHCGTAITNCKIMDVFSPKREEYK